MTLSSHVPRSPDGSSIDPAGGSSAILALLVFQTRAEVCPGGISGYYDLERPHRFWVGFVAARSQSVSFNQLHQCDHSRVKQVLYCQAEDKPVSRSELVGGFSGRNDGRGR
jgi:hypothetical protein